MHALSYSISRKNNPAVLLSSHPIISIKACYSKGAANGLYLTDEPIDCPDSSLNNSPHFILNLVWISAFLPFEKGVPVGLQVVQCGLAELLAVRDGQALGHPWQPRRRCAAGVAGGAHPIQLHSLLCLTWHLRGDGAQRGLGAWSM